MNKLKELAGYVVAIIVILAVAYYTGFLKGFSANDFRNLYDNMSSSISQNTNKAGKLVPDKIAKKNGSFSGYRTIVLPSNIIKASNETGAWTDIFRSSKPSIFYIYDDNDEFHTSLKAYTAGSKLSGHYNFRPYQRHAFKNYTVGNSSFAKICNSMQECNELRKHSQDYVKVKDFLENCGRTLCVINPNKGEYVVLRNRNVNDAKKLIEGLKNW